MSDERLRGVLRDMGVPMRKRRTRWLDGALEKLGLRR